MTPYEILLSESQERMLVVAHRGREADVAAILEKWDLTAAVIGHVIEEPVYRVTEGARVVAEFPGSRLVSDCPMYTPAASEADAVRRARETDVSAITPRAEESDPAWTLLELMASPTIASKAWAFGQYDSTVRTSTVIGPGGDAAVLRIRGSNKAIAVKTDGNGRYVYLDPREGGRIAVAEAARNVACTGARPMAITNCLNFGNPRKPEVYYQLREAIAGIGEACSALGTPVTGGNVSLYNESPTGAVFPTPVIGMVGLIPTVEHITRSGFTRPGLAIVLLGEPRDEIGGSEYLARIHGMTAGAPPACDLAAEAALIDCLLALIAGGHVSSAHDCSDGGLAVALAECCVADPLETVGASVDLSAWGELPLTSLLFGETQGRVVISTADPERAVAESRRRGVPAFHIGTVEDSRNLSIRVASTKLEVSLRDLGRAYHEAIPSIMSRSAIAPHTETAGVT